MAQITIDTMADCLNRHNIVYDKNIKQTVKMGIELEKCMKPVVATHTYCAPSAEVKDIVQAYQCDFTCNNEIEFTAVENTFCRMKIDICFDCDQLDQFWDTWQAEWVEDGKPREQWALPRYIYDTFIVPKIIENMDYISFWGEYAAPTPGVAGLTINACDGLRKKIMDATAAGLVTPIPTGPLLASTMVEQIETFCDSIPMPYRKMPGKLLMSCTNETKYWRDYRAQFGTGNGVSGNENKELRVDCTKKKITGIGTLEGSDVIIFIPDGLNSAIYGRRRNRGGIEAYMPKITWQRDCRELKGFTEFSRFWGFCYWGHTFINDQI